MNIFFLDSDITKCAQAHCDRHVNKMILESAQLLASAIHIAEPGLVAEIPDLYRLTHKNHPCAVWVRSSINHYLYLMDLMEALNEECQYRYAHSRIHVSLEKVLSWPIPKLPDMDFIEPPKCVSDDLKPIPSTIEAYRSYYNRDKREIAAWTRREPPDWWLKNIDL